MRNAIILSLSTRSILSINLPHGTTSSLTRTCVLSTMGLREGSRETSELENREIGGRLAGIPEEEENTSFGYNNH